MNELYNFSDRIKYVRMEVLRMTQADFSKALNVTQARVSMFERGMAQPPYEFFELIYNKFGVSSDYLINNLGEPKATMQPRVDTEEVLNRLFGVMDMFNERLDKIEDYLTKKNTNVNP